VASAIQEADSVWWWRILFWQVHRAWQMW